MIPKDFITEWRQCAPWISDAQVEQDLVISRAILELYSDELISKNFAFRGGTALYKLFFNEKPARYSEDIDLVQINVGPIGKYFERIKEILNPWLGKPKRNQKEGTVNLIYCFDSEDSPSRPLRLKIEINSREHFTKFGYTYVPFEVNSRWVRGQVSVRSYKIEELLGTKLRALYQRKKGRDLFDLWFALKNANIDSGDVVNAFKAYISWQKCKISKVDFEENIALKLQSKEFMNDIRLLLRVETEFDMNEAAELVLGQLIGKI